jgi:hypothetical protein
MSVGWRPPRPTHHLRVFGISLILVVLCLAAFLFGVQMEAKVPATGVVTARDLQEVRATIAGLAEPGWYDGVVAAPGAAPLRVRVDSQGNGSTDPAAAPATAVHGYEWSDGERRLRVQELRFHRLEPGDVLWPGQVLATVRADDLRSRMDAIDDQLKEQESRGEPSPALLRERDRLRERLAQTVLHVPECGQAWMALAVSVAQLQAVGPGDVLATVVPIDPHTRQPLDLLARLTVDEKHWGALCRASLGEQTVRIYSNAHNHHLHGHAEARIERLEPAGEPTATGERQFHALAAITQTPYVLPLGSSFKAEIVVGRKLVYRIILEH